VKARALVAGIDTLSLGARGSVPRDFYNAVARELEQNATEQGRDKRFEVAGEVFVVERGGRFACARLVREDLVVLVRVEGSGALNNPELTFDVPSATLWRDGWRPTWERCARIAAAIFRFYPRAFLVSRVDLCADVEGAPFGESRPDEWVGRWRSESEHGDWQRNGKRTTGWGFGARDSRTVYGRAYNKTVELRVSKKVWLLPIWQEQGWLGGDVWRVEFMLKRDLLSEWHAVDRATGELLKHLTPDTIEGFGACVPGLWAYLVGGAGEPGWLTWRQPTGHKNNRRWPLRDGWRAVQAADWSRVLDGPQHPGVRIEKRRATFDQLALGARGYFTALQALSGEPDPEVFGERLLREIAEADARARTTRETEVANRAIKLNADHADGSDVPSIATSCGVPLPIAEG
jgi:hypothetical protein